ncbi:MAG: AGE family epimerase/isomerase [Bacteroidales bacterium]|nr:AGE family epimerase/isomerase [Bacteroidales bacterium]
MDKKYENSLLKVLEYARKRDYKGYNKYDALDSKVLWFLSFGIKFLRLLYSQVIMRSPINLRPIFFVPKTRNPKGIALFAMSYLNLYKAKGDKKHLEEARTLLDWLIENPAKSEYGMCWGYQHPWQDVGFFARAHLPNRVVTYFVCTAMMNMYDISGDKKYYDAAHSAIPFLLNAPKVLYEDETMKCLSYVPSEKINWIVMDVSILTGSILARINSVKKDESLGIEARKLVNFVVDKQTDYGAWYYTHPAKDHPRKHDNYHTGYIVDAIYDYMKYSEDRSFEAAYQNGIKYYEEHLFLPNGAPRWANDKTYPLDVHGSAQGIISFTKLASQDNDLKNLSIKIADWAIDNMQNKRKGFFYYQKTSLFKKPFTLMRWSDGWMSRGLSELVVLLSQKSEETK